MSQTAKAGVALFDELVLATGIDRMVAPFTVRRLLMRVGVFRVEALKSEDVERVRPHLATELVKYLDPGEHRSAMARIDALVAAMRA